jgi:hypothetical protein
MVYWSQALQCKSPNKPRIGTRLQQVTYQYAVSGAVCSNEITPRITSVGSINAPFPDVVGYEIPAFMSHKSFVCLENNTAFMNIPANKTVYSMWIGTNNLGNGAFLTGSKVPGKNVIDYINCIYETFDNLYGTSGKYFVLMNLLRLNLAPQYVLPSADGVKRNNYFQGEPANRKELSYRMMEQVVLVDDDSRYRAPFEMKITNQYPAANFAVFDVWRLVCLAVLHVKL